MLVVHKIGRVETSDQLIRVLMLPIEKARELVDRNRPLRRYETKDLCLPLFGTTRGTDFPLTARHLAGNPLDEQFWPVLVGFETTEQAIRFGSAELNDCVIAAAVLGYHLS
jgi:hypothetical protein